MSFIMEIKIVIQSKFMPSSNWPSLFTMARRDNQI